MMPRNTTKKLLVEGARDKRIIPYLMEANGIPWPKGHEPVDISAEANGFDGLIDDNAVETWLKASMAEAVGVVFDADEPSDRRWERLRASCSSLVSTTLPQQLPNDGLVVQSRIGPSLGFWMMPDNRSRGMMETFLQFLVPESAAQGLWGHACSETLRAKSSFQAPFKTRHMDKAKIYTWLAWQDEPGHQLHQAIEARVFDPTSPHARPFVAWFRRLFDV